MCYKLILISLSFIFGGCLDKTLYSNEKLEPADCQACHAPSPETGDHTFHLFKQTRRKQITCDECHASTIKQLNWTYILDAEIYHAVQPWDVTTFDGNILTFVKPLVDTVAYPFCFHQIQNDSLFEARIDTFYRVEKKLNAQDSIILNSDQWVHFPYDFSQFVVDTGLGNFIDTLEVKVYKEPKKYSICNFHYQNDTLYKMSVGDFDQFVRSDLNLASVITREEINRLYIISADPELKDTLLFNLKPIDKTPLYNVSETYKDRFSTYYKDERHVLIREDTLFYQLKNDSLFNLTRDSVIDFTRSPFADVSDNHGNGLIDIEFLHEATTVYREDTLSVVLDSITGEPLRYEIESKGAWDVKRQSCWSSGIKTAQCHDGVTGETFWYLPPAR